MVLPDSVLNDPTNLVGHPMAFASAAKGGKFGASTTTMTATSVQRILVQKPAKFKTKRLKLVAAWLQDVSGSMWGDRCRRALDGLSLFHSDVLHDDDYLGVLTFDSSVNILHAPMKVGKIDKDADRRKIAKAGGGCTAIYDSIKVCVDNLKDKFSDVKYAHINKDALFQLVLVTDGGDNSSRTSLSDAAALVARPGIPNFHLVVVGIGMGSSTAATLRDTLCAPHHAQYIDVTDVGQLGSTMRRVVKDVQSRLIIKVQVQTMSVSATVGGGGGDAALSHSLSRLMIGNGRGVVGGGRGSGNGGGRGKGAGRGGGVARKPPTCVYWKKGDCKNGMNCTFSHS